MIIHTLGYDTPRLSMLHYWTYQIDRGHNVNNLRYANDTVLIAENKEDLQQLLDIIEEESSKKGLELNNRKTEVTVVETMSV